jgi:hypothetical protein
MKIKVLVGGLFVGVCIFFVSVPASAQEMTSSGRNIAQLKLMTIPGLPRARLAQFRAEIRQTPIRSSSRRCRRGARSLGTGTRLTSTSLS